MTTGVRDDDFRTSVTLFDGSTQLIGNRVLKTWTGVDRPVVPLEYESTWAPWIDRKGRTRYRRVVRRKRLSRQASLEPHNYNCTWSKVNSTYCTFKLRGILGPLPDGRFDGGTFATFGPPSPTSQWTDNDTLKLIGKLRERIQGSDFNVGVFSAELGKSLGLITETATRIYKIYKELRRKTLRISLLNLRLRGRSHYGADTTSIQSELARLGKEVLAIQYGWRPLLQDMEGGAQWAAQQFALGFSQRYRARRSVKGVVTPGSPFYKIGFSYYVESRQIIAILKAGTSPIPWTFADVASTAWELVPFSFVADWVVPIGPYLEAVSLVQSLDATFVTTTKNQYAAAEITDVPSGIPGQYDTVGWDGSHSLGGSCVRTVLPYLDVPLPKVKSFGKVASLEHCVNAIALLTQFATGGPKSRFSY